MVPDPIRARETLLALVKISKPMVIEAFFVAGTGPFSMAPAAGRSTDEGTWVRKVWAHLIDGDPAIVLARSEPLSAPRANLVAPASRSCKYPPVLLAEPSVKVVDQPARSPIVLSEGGVG